mgnify:CR=1 FL=1
MTDETTLRIGHVMRRFVVDKWGGTETVVFNRSEERRVGKECKAWLCEYH